MSEIVNEILGGKGGGGGAGLTPAEQALLATVTNKQDKVIPSTVGNIQGLDALGNTVDLGYTIPELQALISQGIVKVVNTISDRNAIITSERAEGLEAFVIDATGDATVNSGGAMYILKAGLTNADWIKTYEAESLDLLLTAQNVSYDNTTSGATSINLQDLGDELAQEIDNLLNNKVDKTYLVPFARTQYVDINGNDANDGSQFSPKRTFLSAHNALPSDSNYKDIIVGQGNFTGNTTISKDRVKIKGNTTKGRSHTTFDRTLTITGNQCTIDGLGLTGASGQLIITGTNPTLNLLSASSDSPTNVVNITVNGFCTFNDYDLSNKNVVLSGAGTVYITNCANSTFSIANAGIVVLKTNSPSVTQSGATPVGSAVIDFDTRQPTAYSLIRQFTALGSPANIAVGTLIVNDDDGETLQNLKCTTAYTIAAALGVGTPIDKTKYQVQTDDLKANDNAVVHLTGAETVAGLKTFSTAPNLSSLTASQRLETDASKNVISVAKNTADNKNFGNTAGEVVEGGTVYIKSEVDALLLNTEDKFEIGRRIAKQYSSELYDVTAYLKTLTYTNVSTEAQLLAAILVEGFVVKLTSNITLASQINFAQKGVLHLNGFTINASVPTVVVNITKAVIISGGTFAHEKLIDTSVEVLIKINTPANERAILHNLTVKHVEFGVDLNGCWALQNVHCEYNTPFGTATDSHRHVAIKTVLGDCFIDNITFGGIPQVATTRYTNFILADITEWTGNLHIRNVKQNAVGALRQFLNFQTLGVNVTAGKLIIQDCNFNDLNGGIFFLTAGALDKMEYIILTNNEQGGDAVGGFKGLLYFSFTGALGTKSKIIHYNNKTLAGALRADYVSLIPTADTANTGIIARQNTVTINAGQEYAVANKSIVDAFHQDFYRKGELDVALNTKQNITDNTLNTTSKTIVGSINELKTSIDGKVVDAINDGVTSSAPSQNAVFDALALKANQSTTYTKTETDTALALKQKKVYDYTDTEANILLIDPTANNGKTAKATDTLKEYISNGTAWEEIAGSVASGENITKTITQNSHNFAVNKLLALNGGAYVLADCTDFNKMPAAGFVTQVIDANNFVLGTSGFFPNFTGLTPSATYYASTNGDYTNIPPTSNKQIVFCAETATSIIYGNIAIWNSTGFAQSPYRVGHTIYHTGEYADFTDAFGRWLLEDGRAFSRTTYSELYAKYTIQFTGNITNGLNVITNVADTTRIAVGRKIEGIGIPAGATVASITTNTITLSANATASTTAVSLRYFIFGNGDGSTTYNIADARGRVRGSIGQGTGLTNRKAGDRVGTEQYTLTEANIPTNFFKNTATGATESGGLAFVSTLNPVGGQPFSLYQPTAFDGSSFVFAGTN